MAKPLTKKQIAENEKNDAIAYLRMILPPGSRFYTTVTHVSRSGMSRRINAYATVEGEIVRISHYVARAIGEKTHASDCAIIMGGCGMDMGYHLAMCVSYAIHGNKTVGADALVASEKGRPFEPTAEQYRSGYSLRHSWL